MATNLSNALLATDVVMQKHGKSKQGNTNPEFCSDAVKKEP